MTDNGGKPINERLQELDKRLDETLTDLETANAQLQPA